MSKSSTGREFHREYSCCAVPHKLHLLAAQIAKKFEQLIVGVFVSEVGAALPLLMPVGATDSYRAHSYFSERSEKGTGDRSPTSENVSKEKLLIPLAVVRPSEIVRK